MNASVASTQMLHDNLKMPGKSTFMTREFVIAKEVRIMHLDRAESDIQVVVQIEPDARRSKAKSNISLKLHSKSYIRRGTVQQMLYYGESNE